MFRDLRFLIFSGCDHAGLGPESTKASQHYVSKERLAEICIRCLSGRITV